MSDQLIDRMIVLGRELNQGCSDILRGCYARLTPDKSYLRIDMYGRTNHISQKDFKECDNDTIIANAESYFS